MEIIKNKDHYLLKNDKGEYHLSVEEFEKLGEVEAIKLAKSEIDRKLNSSYQDTEIDFKRAREMGFCEYGIKDFAEKLSLNVDESYSVSFLKSKLTVDVLLRYPDECFKLFGKNALNKFGGPREFLKSNKTRVALDLILIHFVEDKTAHKLACDFALRCIDNYEKEFPDDNRPRAAIEAKLKWIDGKLSDNELSAAESVAWSAAWSAESAAWSAESAARSTELDWQIGRTLEVMSESEL